MDRIYRRNLIYKMQTVNGRIILMGNREAFEMNAVAEFVWKMLDGNRTLRQICDSVKQNFAEAEEAVSLENDIVSFLEEMERAGVVLKV